MEYNNARALEANPISARLEPYLVNLVSLLRVATADNAQALADYWVSEASTGSCVPNSFLGPTNTTVFEDRC